MSKRKNRGKKNMGNIPTPSGLGSSSPWTPVRAARDVEEIRNYLLDFVLPSPYNRLWRRDSIPGDIQALRRGAGDALREEGSLVETALSLFGFQATDSDFEGLTENEVIDLYTSRCDEWIKKSLRLSEAYVVTPGMLDALIAASSVIEMSHLSYLRLEDIHSPHGFLLLPEPVVVGRDPLSLPTEAVALSWSLESWPGRVQPRLRCSLWSKPVLTPRTRGQVKVVSGPTPRLWNSGSVVIALDLTVDGEEYESGILRPDYGDHPDSNVMAFNMGSHDPGAVVWRDPNEWAIVFLFSFFRMISQRQISSERTSESRSSKAGTRRGGQEARLISLKRYEASGDNEGLDESGMKGRSLSVRFPVRVHPVRQWYPSEQIHRVIFRGPYIKGPDDAPFIPSKKVYRI